MARIVTDNEGFGHAILSYTHFETLGLHCDPAVPRVCVPLFDSIDDWLRTPLDYAAEQDANIVAAAKLAGKALPEVAAQLGKPSSAWLRAPVAPLYKMRSIQPGLLFRGEPQDELGLIPTLFRIAAGADPERVVAQRRRRQRRRAGLMRAAGLVSRGLRLTTGQAAAVARHYGVTSPALDFTYEPRVAASFAVAGQASSGRPLSEQIAILYAIELDRIAEIALTKGWKPNPDGGSDTTLYGLPPQLDVPYDSFDETTRQVVRQTARISFPEPLTSCKILLRTVLVPGIARIERQQGAFLELSTPGHWIHEAQLWYLLDFLAIKWCLAPEADPGGRQKLLDGHAALFPSDGRLLSWLGRRLGTKGKH